MRRARRTFDNCSSTRSTGPYDLTVGRYAGTRARSHELRSNPAAALIDQDFVHVRNDMPGRAVRASFPTATMTTL